MRRLNSTCRWWCNVLDADVEIRWTRGTGPGGQHRNKSDNCCVMTHRPSGLSVTVDGRSRPHNEREARRLLRDKIEQARLAALAARRKAHRDAKISASQKRIRTYDLTKGVVKDHRTGKTASVKDILGKGKLEKLQ